MFVMLASCEDDTATLSEMSTVLKELLVRVKRTEDDVKSLKKERSQNNSSAEKKPAAVPLVVRVRLYILL